MNCHPHSDPQHIVTCYRKYILSCKRKYGTARSQVHYRELMATYVLAKQDRDRRTSIGDGNEWNN